MTGTPGHINSMATCIHHFLKAHPPETLRPGDVLITNDPWQTAGQLHDLTVITPAFRRGRLTAFFGNTCHAVDIGGRGHQTMTVRFRPDRPVLYSPLYDRVRFQASGLLGGWPGAKGEFCLDGRQDLHPEEQRLSAVWPQAPRLRARRSSSGSCIP